MTDPVDICCSGGHIYCYMCVRQLIIKSKSASFLCPQCRSVSSMKSIRKIPFIDRQIKRLCVYCPNTSHATTTSYREPNTNQAYREASTVSGHDEECEERNALWCEWKGAWCDLKAHLRECEFETIACEYCDESVKREHMELHLAITCPKSQVDCICGETLLRETQPMHSETVCPEHPIKCEFDQFGCTQMIKRKDMQAHAQEKMPQHLAAVTRQYQHLVSKMDAVMQSKQLTVDEKMLAMQQIAAETNRSSASPAKKKATGNGWTFGGAAFSFNPAGGGSGSTASSMWDKPKEKSSRRRSSRRRRHQATGDKQGKTETWSFDFKQQQILSKKRELDETWSFGDHKVKADHNSDNSHDDDASGNSDAEAEARRLEHSEQTKAKQAALGQQQKQSIFQEQQQRKEAERAWISKRTDFVYKASKLEFSFGKRFKLTQEQLDQINRIEWQPLSDPRPDQPRVRFLNELVRDVLIKQHHRRQSTLARLKSVSLEEEDDDQESGVFHVRLNGVCTFTPYEKLHRSAEARQQLKHNVMGNFKKGRRITARRYFEGMGQMQKVTCWIQLDEYLQEYLLDHGMKSINMYGPDDEHTHAKARGASDEEDEEEEEDKDKRQYDTYHPIFMSKRIAVCQLRRYHVLMYCSLM